MTRAGLAWMAMALAPLLAVAQPLPQPKLARARALAWDGKALWTLGDDAKLRMIDADSGAEVRAIDTGGTEPRAAAFDGKRFWIADGKAMSLSAIDPSTGAVVKRLELRTPAEKGFKSIEGLAWDGRHLWVAYFAGFSSSLNEIDPESGRIVRSVYADCHPRGLATDGKRLWTLCFNGDRAPSVVDERPIVEREHEMLRARVFVAKVDAKDPSGLAYDGRQLAVVDRATRKLVKVPLRTPR